MNKNYCIELKAEDNAAKVVGYRSTWLSGESLILSGGILVPDHYIKVARDKLLHNSSRVLFQSDTTFDVSVCYLKNVLVVTKLNKSSGNRTLPDASLTIDSSIKDDLERMVDFLELPRSNL